MLVVPVWWRNVNMLVIISKKKFVFSPVFVDVVYIIIGVKRSSLIALLNGPTMGISLPQCLQRF